MNLVWDNSFSSGIEEIDAQHKDFIKLIQRLQVLQSKHTAKDFVMRILLEVVTYAEYHFVSEENLMMVIKYPVLKDHQLEHQKLLRNVTYKVKSYEDNLEKLESLIDFLCDWLVKHTKGEDVKIGEFLRALRAPAASAESEASM